VDESLKTIRAVQYAIAACAALLLLASSTRGSQRYEAAYDELHVFNMLPLDSIKAGLYRATFDLYVIRPSHAPFRSRRSHGRPG
jgi:hypothetical protein